MEEDEGLCEEEDSGEDGVAIVLAFGEAVADPGGEKGGQEAGELGADASGGCGAEGVEGGAEGSAPDVDEEVVLLEGEAGVEVMDAGVGFEEIVRGDGRRQR